MPRSIARCSALSILVLAACHDTASPDPTAEPNVDPRAVVSAAMPEPTAQAASQPAPQPVSDAISPTPTPATAPAQPAPSATPAPAVEPPPPAVQITQFTATPSQVSAGQATTLSWSVQNATRVTLNGVAVSGTQASASVTATTTYTLVAEGTGGPVSVSTAVSVAPGAYCGANEKIDLWKGPTKLRGANIEYRYEPGSGVWPIYSQANLNALASRGANYVEMSAAGIFTQSPPYVVDEGAAAEVKRQLDMAYAAHLWAVIAFRTGPARTEDVLDNATLGPLWTDTTAQAAWTAMWRETAKRFQNHPALAGYKVMVEPETSDATLWGSMATAMVAGIRSIDASTPIMVGGVDWENISSLDSLPHFTDPRIVYSFHQYDPYEYTTGLGGAQPSAAQVKAIFDPAAAFQQARGGVPLVMSEFGIERGTVGAATVLGLEYAQADRLEAATALWDWQTPSDSGWYQANPFTIELLGSDMQSVITAQWAKNACRPQ